MGEDLDFIMSVLQKSIQNDMWFMLTLKNASDQLLHQLSFAGYLYEPFPKPNIHQCLFLKDLVW